MHVLPWEMIYYLTHLTDNLDTLHALNQVSHGWRYFASEALQQKYLGYEFTYQKLDEQEGVSAAIHDAAKQIIVYGFKEPNQHRMATIFNYRNKKITVLNSIDVELSHIALDKKNNLIIGGLKSNAIAIWNLLGNLKYASKEECPLEYLVKDRHIYYQTHDSYAVKKLKTKHYPLFTGLPTQVHDRNEPLPPDMNNKWMSSQYHTTFLAADDAIQRVIHVEQNKIKVLNSKNLSEMFHFNSTQPNKSYYSKKKQWLVYKNDRNKIEIKNLNNQKTIQCIKLQQNEGISLLHLDENTDTLIAITRRNDGKNWMNWVHIWDAISGKETHHFGIPNPENGLFYLNSTLLYLPQFNLLLTGTLCGSICFSNLLKKELAKVISVCSSPIHQLSYDGKSHQLISTHLDPFGKSQTWQINLFEQS